MDLARRGRVRGVAVVGALVSVVQKTVGASEKHNNNPYTGEH
jgi:hypothetical protein